MLRSNTYQHRGEKMTEEIEEIKHCKNCDCGCHCAWSECPRCLNLGLPDCQQCDCDVNHLPPDHPEAL